MYALQDTRVSQSEALMMTLTAGDDAAAAIVRAHLATGGKRLRARLALSAVDALGGNVRAAVPWASACELFHNATLIHDDIQDGDTLRRGKPTMWKRYGIPQALNAGDLIFLLPFEALAHLDATDTIRFALTQALARFGAQVIRGQALEIQLTESLRISQKAYDAAIAGKTSALFYLPVLGAALCCGRDAKQAEALASPFGSLGMLFQLQDDVLDLYGDKGRDAPGADLAEGKVSALVVKHLQLCPDDTGRLTALLKDSRETTCQSEIQWAIDAFVDSGALSGVLGDIDRYAKGAIDAATHTDEPRLSALAESLVETVLAPIAHLKRG